MKFAPAIRWVLFQLIDEIDDGKKGFATVWRELGYAARARGYYQPSYESVRRIVTAVRERRRLEYLRAKRALILSAEYLWNTRDRKGIVLDIIDGADIARRRSLYQRRL